MKIMKVFVCNDSSEEGEVKNMGLINCVHNMKYVYNAIHTESSRLFSRIYHVKTSISDYPL